MIPALQLQCTICLEPVTNPTQHSAFIERPSCLIDDLILWSYECPHAYHANCIDAMHLSLQNPDERQIVTMGSFERNIHHMNNHVCSPTMVYRFKCPSCQTDRRFRDGWNNIFKSKAWKQYVDEQLESTAKYCSVKQEELESAQDALAQALKVIQTYEDVHAKESRTNEELTEHIAELKGLINEMLGDNKEESKDDKQEKKAFEKPGVQLQLPGNVTVKADEKLGVQLQLPGNVTVEIDVKKLGDLLLTKAGKLVRKQFRK